MNIITFPTGIYGVNTYLIENSATHETIMIDPGGSFDLIQKMLDDNKLKLKHVLLTHGHFDHIGALEQVRSYYGVDVYAHAECSKTIFDPLLNLSVYDGIAMDGQVKCEPVDHTLADGQECELCGLKFKAIHAPGHSRGSMVYVVGRCAFTGDVLFKMSIGRTDFLGSDANAMHDSLVKLKGMLTSDMQILPGHGEESYMSKELESNPFLQNL